MQNEMIKNLMDKNKETDADSNKEELEATLKNKNIEKNLLSQKESQLKNQTTGADLTVEGMTINELKTCVEEKEHKIEQMQCLIRTLNQLTSNLKEDLNKMGEVVNGKNETIFTLQLDNKKVTNIESKLDTLKERMLEVKKEFDKQGDMNRELSAENQMKNVRISKLEIKLNKKRNSSKKYERAKSLIKHLKERDAKYGRKLMKLKESIKNNAETITKLQQDAAEIESSIKTKDESIAKLKIEAALMEIRLKKKFSAEKKDIVGKMSAEMTKQEAENAESFQKYLSDVNANKSKVRC